MSIFRNILDSVKLTEDEDYDDYVSDMEERDRKRMEKQEQKQALKQEKKNIQKTRATAADSSQAQNAASTNPLYNASSFSDARKERVQRMEKNNVSKVVPLRSAQTGLEVCIMKPTSFEDSQDICDMLLSGRAAVINLEGFDVDIAQRVMDFISGAVYALNGKLHQISSFIFIISPDNVDISGDYLDLIRQNGFEVPTLNK